AHLVKQAEEMHANLVEEAAEGNEELMNKYLVECELTEAEIQPGLRQRTLNNEMVLCLCGSAFKNKGVQAMLDAVVEFLPSPTEVKALGGILEDNSEGVRKSSDDEPFSALAFKIATDPFVGTLTFLRVYSGVLS